MMSSSSSGQRRPAREVCLPLQGCVGVTITNKNNSQNQNKTRRRRTKKTEITQPETTTAGLVVTMSLILMSPSLLQQETAVNLHATIALLQAAKQLQEEQVVASTAKEIHQFFQGRLPTYRVRVNSFDSMRLCQC